MEKHAEIVVYGRVHKAGFRDFIDEIAFNLNLNGYVKNLDDGTVQIICEGEEDIIKELLKKINIIQYPIRVENIDVVYKKSTGKYRTFEIIREEDLTTATYERMDAAVRYIREMNLNLSQKMDNLGSKMDNLGENLGSKMDNLGSKMDNLGSKMDNLGSKMDNLGENLGSKIDNLGENLGSKMDDLGENLGNKIDQNRIEITSEIHSSRDDSKYFFDERISMIEGDVAQIKAKLMLKH
ncbi:MAG: acylphosphatase [Euryarchaeota archaeon]|nr:acylphosphatase [Euryarchaeota archaeon]